jgi:protein-tyrosine phosphatase
MAAVSQPVAEQPQLFLGTETFIKSKAWSELHVTHRLSCLMSPHEEIEWMRYAENSSHGEVSGSSQPTFNASTEMDDEGIILCSCPMADEDLFGPFAIDLLNYGAAFIDSALSSSSSSPPPVCVYVHCSQGVSRSPTMVMWYLMKYRGFTAIEAVKHVKSRRVKVSPTESFVTLLLNLEQELMLNKKDGGPLSTKEEVTTELKRDWLSDYKAGKIHLSHFNQILPVNTNSSNN